MIRLMKMNSATYYSNYTHRIIYKVIFTATVPYVDVKPRTKKTEHSKTLSVITTYVSSTHLDSSSTYSAIDLTSASLQFSSISPGGCMERCGCDYFSTVIESVPSHEEDLNLNKVYGEEFRSVGFKRVLKVRG